MRLKNNGMVSYYYVKKLLPKQIFGEGIVLTLILFLGLYKIVLVVKNYVLLLQTTNIEKVMLKSTPILFISYYLMFGYCLNGQQLTDKVNKNSLSILT